MPRIAARFYVAEVTRQAYGTGKTDTAVGRVVMRAVSRGGEDNKQWSSATPSGEFSMTVTNPDALAAFNDLLGEDVAITIQRRSEVDGTPDAG